VKISEVEGLHFHAFFLRFVLLSPFLTGLVACSGDVVSAEIVNAVVNSADFSLQKTQSTFPSPLPCKENRYTITGGSYRIEGIASATTASVFVSISMQFPRDSEFQTEDQLSFICDLQATYGWDASKGRLTGAGEIENCDKFRCEYRSEHISCEKMREALRKYSCQ